MLSLADHLSRGMGQISAFAPFAPGASSKSLLSRGLAIEAGGTVFVLLALPDQAKGGMISPRLRICQDEDWECYRDLPLAQPGESSGWRTLPEQQACFAFEVESTCEYDWTLQLDDGEFWQIRWRPDLDGHFELSRKGDSYQPDCIEPDPDDRLFGWLHPAYPYAFSYQGVRHAHCAWGGWPYPQRKAFALQHGMDLAVARDSRWFDRHPDDANLPAYLQEVNDRLAARAQSWPGWIARCQALQLPLWDDEE